MGGVNCITELQEFKDRNAWSTLGQLTSDRLPVSSSQNGGICIFAPFLLLTLVLTHPRGFLAVKGNPPQFLTQGCCPKLCVFSAFRILPHKSACLLPSLWEQLSFAFPPITALLSGNGSLRLGNNRRLCDRLWGWIPQKVLNKPLVMAVGLLH